jgi:SAM-dependent methyltransferase
MTEERRAAPAPRPDTDAAPLGPRSPSASDEHPTGVVGAPDTDPSQLDATADRTSEVPSSSRSSDDLGAAARVALSRDGGSARRRSRMLRIPDDEVARPKVAEPSPSPAPAAPRVSDSVVPPRPVEPLVPRFGEGAVVPRPVPRPTEPPRPASESPARAPADGAAPRRTDSVVPRPADTTPAPPPAQDSGVVLMPMRIITIGPSEAPTPAEVLAKANELREQERRSDDVASSEPATEPERPTPIAPVRSPFPSEDLIPVDSEPSEPTPVSVDPSSIDPSSIDPSSIDPSSIDPIEDVPTPRAPAVIARSAPEPEGVDIPFDEDVPTPAAPQLQKEGDVGSERTSDPGSEISAEEMEAEDAAPSPPQAPASPSQVRSPMATTGPSPAARPPAPPKPPLVIVPPHVGTMAPQGAEGASARRKGRLWWEELFNDDYLRTCERLTDEQLSSEVHFIEDRLSIERGGAVLDLGCGTGRHAVELARRGYEVVGFDLSLAMLARAGEEAQDHDAKLNFVQGDMREMSFEAQFDGVYCWNTTFGFFEEDKNAQVIDRVHRALKTGGLLLLDVINRDFLIRQSPSLAWFEGDGCVCMDEMNVDFITSRMRVKRTIMLDDGRSREIEYSVRVYSLHELGRILHEHRFKVCEVSGRIGTPGVFFGNESPRIIILAEKR